ncbi:MAG: hypothetical protein Q4G63_01900 [Bacteroidia bacterium]|nr:hypothetical protein [Bacteroidia bacterium]
MNEGNFKDIVDAIRDFQERLKSHLPAMEAEIEQIITSQSKDANTIENYLDTLLSLTAHGVGDELFGKLLDYYKTVNSIGAKFYWEEYENME